MGKVVETTWRQKFAEIAHICSERVKNLPKGERLKAFRQCMSELLSKAYEELKGK